MKTYFKEIIDLGHEYYNNMPNLGASVCCFWPLETFEHTRKITSGKLATEGKMMLMPEHCGTHIDAPRHFDEHGKTVDEVPLAETVLPGHLLDLTHRKNGQAIMTLLAQIAKDQSRGVLVVTHDPRVIPFADRIVHIEDGKIVSEEAAVPSQRVSMS